jgi:serine/threonine protein phosphatase PrpC
MTCPTCGEALTSGDAFCENCGADVVGTEPAGSTLALMVPEQPGTHRIRPTRTVLDRPPPTCTECGEATDPDGWCTVCGARASNGRDYIAESPGPTVGAVSDRGRRHLRNEDAFAVSAAGDWTALVVCDGVATTDDSDEAAYAAARAARDLLAAAPRPTESRVLHWTTQLKAAAVAADEAADSVATKAVGSAPSCTFVAAVADHDLIVAAWIGDSRAYWLPDGGPGQQLTIDDSWAAEQIRAGVPREQAEADVNAHAITRWLGADAPTADASTASITTCGPGWLLVCSDGLWNYCSGAENLRTLADPMPPEPLKRAEALVQWANAQGGHDNITVTLARIGGS